MKRTTKYVGLDVHQESTVSSVREEGGRVIARTIVPTETSAIIEFFRGMRGTIHVVFEEGTQAQWLHDLIAPLVARVVVCDRRGETHGTGYALEVIAGTVALAEVVDGEYAVAVGDVKDTKDALVVEPLPSPTVDLEILARTYET